MASSVTASSSSSSSSSHTTLSQLSQILSFNVMYWTTLPELFDPIEEFDGDPARLYVPPPPPMPYSDDEDDSEDDGDNVDDRPSWPTFLDKTTTTTRCGQKRTSPFQKKNQHDQQRYRQSSAVTPYHNVRKRRKQHDHQKQNQVRFACHKCGMVFDRLYDHRRHVTAAHARYNKRAAHHSS